MEGSLSDREWRSMKGVVNDQLLSGVDAMGYQWVTMNPLDLSVLTDVGISHLYN